MISLPNPNKTMTTLTEDQRFRLVDFLAGRYLDNMSLKDLERFFFDIQVDYLREYSDEELLSELEDYTSEEELAELMEVAE